MAYPEWADKPYGFANFLRSARFVNSLYNGRLLSKNASSDAGFRYVSYRVRLSRKTEHGMYDMRKRAATRSRKSGFVVPSQDEWVKAAYYDPSGGGQYSYWKYPTNPGVFGDGSATAPSPTTLDPSTGDVTNASTQPLATFHERTSGAELVPRGRGSRRLLDREPVRDPPDALRQDLSGQPQHHWPGEDHVALGDTPPGRKRRGVDRHRHPAPVGAKRRRTWRRLHGGIANAPVYQLWLSAVGLQPQDNTLFTATYPWLGIRVGVVGDLKAHKRGSAAEPASSRIPPRPAVEASSGSVGQSGSTRETVRRRHDRQVAAIGPSRLAR